MGHMSLLHHLVTALYELDSNLLPRGDVLGQLNESKGAPIQICYLHRHMPHVMTQQAWTKESWPYCTQPRNKDGCKGYQDEA